jgi:hypothetical protein
MNPVRKPRRLELVEEIVGQIMGFDDDRKILKVKRHVRPGRSGRIAHSTRVYFISRTSFTI